MRIALINVIGKTMDRPKHFWSHWTRKREDYRPRSIADLDHVKLGQRLADLGHEVTLFVADLYKPHEPYQARGSFQIRYLPTRCRWIFPPAYVPFLPGLYRELRTGNFDIVQVSDLFQPSTLIALTLRRKFIIWQELDQFYTSWLPRLLFKLYLRVFRNCLEKRCLIVPRSQSAAHFLNKNGFAQLGPVVGSPIDTDVFHPISPTEEFLLVVTRLAYDRGLDFLVEVMKKLSKEFPKVKLVVQGDGEFYTEFQKMVVGAGLQDQIEIRRQGLTHSEMNRLYNRSYLTLIPYVRALCPYTALESLACGKPLVSRFSRGLRDVLIDGETGFTTETVEEMVEKIRLLLHSPEKRSQMGQKGRAAVAGHDLKGVASQFLQLYDRLHFLPPLSPQEVYNAKTQT